MTGVSPTSNDHQWRFFSRPHETWEAMFDDCKNARHSIEFEQYILENDPLGERFMDLFVQKAQEGLKIFLICDMFGSLLLHRSKWVRKLREAGGKVHFYNPLSRWSIFTPWRWFPRTHTKTLLVDSTIAYTGGVCMAERMRNWRDTHIRIMGPVTKQIRQAFDEIEHKMQNRHPSRLIKNVPSRTFRYLRTRPLKKRCSIYKELLAAINEAQHYIYISSAFFIPNRQFIELLKHVCDRGVDVRILVPERSDVPLADWVRLSYTPRFLKASLRLFHYQPTILHSKTAIIDDSWGTVGSTNFDVISFFHNREANMMITDKKAIEELKQQFFTDLQCSKELTWEAWRIIPLRKKIIGYCARMLKIFF